MTRTITLDAQNPTFPYDNTPMKVDGSEILILGLNTKGEALGYMNFIYPAGVKSYVISNGLKMPLELSCLGFHFILDNDKEGIELTFTFKIFP